METESNKLIAEFMGVNSDSGWYDGLSLSQAGLPFAYGAMGNGTRELKFHTSWDWLMPVVHKIEFMNQETGYMGVFLIYGLGRTKVECYENEMLVHTIDILSERYGIMPTYKAVVEFINWYNENN